MTDDQVTQGEDVADESPAEENDTSDVSSNEEETSQETGGDDSASSTKESEGKYVPYERFREVNEKAKTLEEKIQALEQKVQGPRKEDNPEAHRIKEQLKPLLDDMGYVSKEELAKQRQDEYYKSELTRLEDKYQGNDGRPKFDRDRVVKFALDKGIGDLETAYEKLNFKEIVNWHVKQAQTKSKGIKTEASDGSGSSGSGITNDDLKVAIGKGDKSALRTFIKRAVRLG